LPSPSCDGYRLERRANVLESPPAVVADELLERPLVVRVSDAGRLMDGATYSAAGVRKPPRKETALKGT
jgi:hypothetical protein